MSKYPTIRNLVAVLALLLATVVAVAPAASAQDVDLIAGALESEGYFIESGAFGDAGDFERLVRESRSGDEPWYFVSMAGPVAGDFSDELRDIVRPRGNVLVYFIDGDGFEVVQLASSASESVEDASLAAFDRNDWTDPEDFMDDVVRDFERLTAPASSGSSSGSSGSSSGSSSSGGGSIWPWLAIPAVLVIGGVWFSGRRRRKKDAENDLETAQKIRAELQTELDELANDVIVLSSPVDLSENDQAIEHYRQATATYTAISDEIPDTETLETLEKADLRQLSELGARVAHARWQMDAAEAIIGGEPVPEKPQIAPPVVETPPAPPQQPQRPTARPRNLERRQPRPRVPYSRSRRRSGGGLLDILIAGGGMLGGNRRRSRRSGGGLGDIFGGGARRSQPRSTGTRSSGSSRSRSRTSSRPRSGGGVFGGGRSTSTRRSTSRRRSRSSSSRTRSRSSSSRRSTSRRRKRR